MAAVVLLRPTRSWRMLFCNGCCDARKFTSCKPVQCRLLSSNASFLREISGPSRRRRRRRGGGGSSNQFRTASPRQRDETTEAEMVDNRTVGDILFPGYTSADVPEEHKIHWPKSLSQWRAAIASAWSDYKWTWDGFTTSRGFLVEDNPTEANSETGDMNDKAREAGEVVAANATRNAKLLKVEAESLGKEIRDRTGINTKEDLQKMAAEAMKLFSNCVKEFMSGYRKGRDDEVEKMLTQYFQEMEQEANKPKRRKRKRRVLGRKGAW